MSENNDNSNESNSMGSDSIVRSSHIMGGSSVGGNPVIRSGVLRPSVLGPSRLSTALSNNSTANNLTSSNDASDEPLAPSGSYQEAATDVSGQKSDEKIINPLKNHKCEEDSESDKQNTESDVKENDNSEENLEDDERPDPMSLLRKNGMERSNLFAAAKCSIPLVEKSGFVFGQNVHERVVGDNLKSDNTTTADNSESTSMASGEGLLFSSVIQNAAAAAKSEHCESASSKDSNIEVKSLTEVAREYEESRAQKRKYEEVETFTGEENETNIVDLNCKLFAFFNSNWEERGRGSLRLNDSKDDECSRLVFRTSGNLRLLLNTKVWAGMVVERSSQKSLRLTAIDNTGKIKIFLVMARPVEISELHSALVDRIDECKESHPDELLCGNSNNDEEHNTVEVKNGTVKHMTDEAASVTEPYHEDYTEPSPKKTIVFEDEKSSNVHQHKKEETANNE